MRRSRIRWAARVSLVLTFVACAQPSTETAPAGREDRIVIRATGDVSLDPSHIAAFATRGYGWAWSGTGGLFLRDDLTIVNLECPATDILDPVDKAFPFRCDPAALPAAVDAGVDVASQANNHAYDQGVAGLLDSLASIRAAGIVPVGAGRDRTEALRAARIRIGDRTVAVVGIDHVEDPAGRVAGPRTPGTAVGHDLELGVKVVRDAATWADLVVVAVHWGVELEPRPRAYQVRQAHRLVDAGADVIFGAHPHVLQPMETYRGRPIFYSLGNFVWPDVGPATSATAVAEVVVTADGRIEGRLIPFRIVSDGHAEPDPG